MKAKTFLTIHEAFDWWIKNIYPNLPPEIKKGRPVTAWRDYTHKLGISETRMKEILLEYGSFEIKPLLHTSLNRFYFQLKFVVFSNIIYTFDYENVWFG